MVVGHRVDADFDRNTLRDRHYRYRPQDAAARTFPPTLAYGTPDNIKCSRPKSEGRQASKPVSCVQQQRGNPVARFNRNAARWMRMGALLFLYVLTLQDSLHTAWAQGSLEDSGLTELDDDGASRGNHWALIIGINYDGRKLDSPQDRTALPPLVNAERDAAAIYALLKSHYGYRDDQITLLTGGEGEKAATAANINREIGKLLDPKVIQSTDSVLIFFAGHGVRLDGEELDRAAIFPYDVQLSNGKPINNYIRLYSDLFAKLKKSNARHKLVILDSCYSGEILKVASFRPPGETEDRSDPQLYEKPSFQAIASCRAFEAASDGKSNSPFATALLRGLQRLPARGGYEKGLWTSELFAYLQPEMKSQTNGQVPQFGILDGDGEFRFFPQHTDPATKKKDRFAEWLPDLNEQKLLQAMTASLDGRWWFEEMPWFVPSLREEILREITPDRSGEGMRVNKEDLRLIAWRIVADKLRLNTKPASPSEVNLEVLRYQHTRMLLRAQGSRQFHDVLTQIAGELLALLNPEDEAAARVKLAATDLHFLALVLHALNREEDAQNYYYLARRSYEQLIAGANGPAHMHAKAMYALCLADHGEFLLHVRRSYDYGARTLREAYATLGNEAPAAFRTVVLCKEAQCLIELNRWAEADDRLEEARKLCEVSASSELAAFVYRSLAWTRMIQWRIDQAEHYFNKSNHILIDVYERSGRTANAAGRPTEAVHLSPAGAEGQLVQFPESFDDWDDISAKVTFLHNAQGLAMAQRLKGRPDVAAQQYRVLAGKIEQAITLVKYSPNNWVREAEGRLYDQLVDTLERLGDCNLFSDPRTRDLQEAADDYRRALARCHLTLRNRHTGSRAQLLYKHALALALSAHADAEDEDDAQKTELAMAICAEADEEFRQTYAAATQSQAGASAEGKMRASGAILALGNLATKLVTLVHASLPATSAADLEVKKARGELRDAIRLFRDEHGPDFHRDQLELCLLAAKTLLDYGNDREHFYANADAELLLGFCRLALAPHAVQGNLGSHFASRVDTRAYLRPYYDAVMRSKVNAPVVNVKEMLEVHGEATTGRVYVKSSAAMPTLALYVLDNDCYLLLDLPHVRGKCVRLATYDLQAIQKASQASETGLPLPREVYKTLVDWKNQTGRDANVPIDLRWQDPLYGLLPEVPVKHETVDTNLDTVVAKKPLIGNFPFALPPGYLPPEGESAPLTAPTVSARE